MRHDAFLGSSARFQVDANDLARCAHITARMKRDGTSKFGLNDAGRLDRTLFKI